MNNVNIIKVENNAGDTGYLFYANGNIEWHKDVGDYHGEPPMFKADEIIPDPVFKGEHLTTAELWELLVNQANNDPIPWLNISDMSFLGNGEWL